MRKVFVVRSTLGSGQPQLVLRGSFPTRWDAESYITYNQNRDNEYGLHLVYDIIELPFYEKW